MPLRNLHTSLDASVEGSGEPYKRIPLYGSWQPDVWKFSARLAGLSVLISRRFGRTMVLA